MKIVGAKVMTRAQIKEYVTRRVNKGLRSAGAFAVGRLKAVVGIQAPRKRSASAICGWVALTRATPGAPPRRVSGCGQKSIYYKILKSGGLAFGASRKYMMILERRNHEWLHKTVAKYFRDIMKIAGDNS